MNREPNCDSALRVDLFSCVFIHFCRAVSYITQMRFHHQLMRFHKTAVGEVDVWLPSDNSLTFKSIYIEIGT